MKILVTGANGFVGKNLVAQLNNIKRGNIKDKILTEDLTIYEYDTDKNLEMLNEYTRDCDFVCHLAGVNRPENQEDFMKGNFGFTSELIDCLEKNNNKAPILVTSSIQAEQDNPYGLSKKAGEDLIFEYGEKSGVKTLVYRLPNLFGKWARPNYNSVIATFCHNIARDLPITVNDENKELCLAYIDDVVKEFIRAIGGNATEDGRFCTVPVVHHVTLGEIARLLRLYREQKESRVMPEIPKGSFEKKLYSTYVSYLPKEAVSFPLKMNVDERGSFTELMRTEKCGQISLNISKPGITKGRHWHSTKWEFFIVISGHGLIQQRKIGDDEIIESRVSGDKIEAVHILPGYTHNIINLSEDEDLLTIMWANEQFDGNDADTYFEEV